MVFFSGTDYFINFLYSTLFPVIIGWLNNNLKPQLFTRPDPAKTLKKGPHRILEHGVFRDIMLKFTISANRVGFIFSQAEISSPDIMRIIRIGRRNTVDVILYLNDFCFRILRIQRRFDEITKFLLGSNQKLNI